MDGLIPPRTPQCQNRSIQSEMNLNQSQILGRFVWVLDRTVGHGEPVKHVAVYVPIEDQASCSPNWDKHGRRVAASHGYHDLDHARPESGALVDRSSRRVIV